MSHRPLGDVARFVNGAAFKPDDWEDGGLPIIRIQNLTGTGEKFNYTKRQVKPELVIEPGDLLVSWSATLDVYRWSGLRGLLNQHIFKVFPNSDIDADYLFFALKSVLVELSSKTHGSTMKHVVRGDFESTQIYVPAIEKQRRIADLLARAEGIVRLRREAQQKAAELIPALFLDLFGDPATNPKHWPQAQLGELLSTIDSGKSPKCHDRQTENDEWGVLRLSALSHGDYDDSEHKTLPADIKPVPNIEVRAGDVLLSRKNTYELVGASAYVWSTQGRLLLPDLIFRLSLNPDSTVDPIYLWKLLSMPAKRAALRSLASGSAGSMPNISKERLRGLTIEVPPIELQRHFAAKTEAVRSIAAQQSAALSTAQSTFAALLHRAFTARSDGSEAMSL